MREKWAKLLIVIGSITCLLWLGGFYWTLQNNFFRPGVTVQNTAKQQEKKQGNQNSTQSNQSNLGTNPQNNQGSNQSGQTAQKSGDFTVLALGDSLTRGAGDPTGAGYVGYCTDILKQKSKQNIILSNLGVNGLTSGQLLEQIKQKEVQRQIGTADTIFISIGGNDLHRGGRTLLEMDLQAIRGFEERYVKNLREILKEIRTTNANAAVFLVGLYNPFINLSDAEVTSKVIRDWNSKTAEVGAAYPKTVFVPTFDLFQLQIDAYLFSDRFHPNAEGYRVMGERMASLIMAQGVIQQK